jgi:hypothetical protein
MSVDGVDYSYDRPSASGLASAGKRFACRYGGPGSSGKQLDAAEARALTRAGIAIVANAEGSTGGLLGGYGTGADWARRTHAHFTSLGMPADRPIYLSVDFDVTSGQWPSVAAALRGAASVLGAGRVGVYGGLHTVTWARRDRVARWFWQTLAWSGGRWAAGNHIEQYRIDVPLAGGTVDLNRALRADYGQWGDVMTPAEFARILDDPAVAGKLRALPWQYVGGGIPTGYSTLKVLSETLSMARRAAAQDVDEQHIIAGVLAGLDPTVIAAAVVAALPAEQARQVVDELGKRLTGAAGSP